MPSWNEVLNELNRSPRKDAIDYIRRKYLKRLHNYTSRNVIAYYSGFLQKSRNAQIPINDSDKNGFMTTIHKLDRSKGLDLFLHTPGGDLTATESLVNYLKSMFGDDIRVIIPQLAMSAGTMIACAGKSIVMGKQSNIGPIDPQFGGFPCYGVIDEFKQAIEDVKNKPESLPIWKIILQKYHPTFLGECQKAIDLSFTIVKGWLKDNMFKDDPDKDAKARHIVEYLSNHGDRKTHSRHIHIKEAKDIGLKIESMEDDCDDKLQDLILTVHHCFMHTFAHTPAIKIIENHKGTALVLMGHNVKPVELKPPPNILKMIQKEQKKQS